MRRLHPVQESGKLRFGVAFKRNAETKVVELYTNAWVAQKTVDEGLLAPDEFENSGVDSVLSKLRTNVGL